MLRLLFLLAGQSSSPAVRMPNILAKHDMIILTHILSPHLSTFSLLVKVRGRTAAHRNTLSNHTLALGPTPQTQRVCLASGDGWC
jgi:hypothetical protein